MADIKRLNYFTSQFLGEKDFNEEQAYHLEMRRRHNRLLHGWGIADGFTVTRGGNNTVVISPGTAIDKNGNEIVLLDPVTKDLSAFGADKWIWLTLRYRQELTDTIQGGATRWAERPTIEADATLPAEDGSVIVVGKIWTDAVGGPSRGIKGIYPDRRKPAGPRADAFVQGLTVSSVPPLYPPAGANTLDVQRVQRRNRDNHPKNLALYVASDSAEAGDLVEFRHSDGTRGIGFGTAVKVGTSYARICAAGSAPDQHLSMVPKGKGEVTFVGNTYAGGDLTVVRNAFLKKSLTVEDTVTLKKTLTVADTATFKKSLTVADTTTLQKSLTITGGQATQITAEANTLDVQRVKREYFDVPATNPLVPGYKGEHPTGLALYVTGTSDEAGKLVEFRNSKGTEGIGFGHNTIYATESDPNQPLRLRARGTGRVEITQENWHEVARSGMGGFKDGWANWDVASEFNSVGYFKDSVGIVHLKGLAKWTKSTANANDIAVIKANNVIFTLFPGYRPEKRHVYAVASGDAPVACRIDVGSSGEVTIMYGTEDLYKTAAQYASLDGISFKAA